MASLDEIKGQATKVAESVGHKALELAEDAGDWASKPHPGMDKAAEAMGNAAEGAIDKAAQGAEAAYEAIKNAVERTSGKDVDGDGQIGATGAAPGEVKAGVEVAAEAVAGAAGKAAGAAKGAFERLVKR